MHTRRRGVALLFFLVVSVLVAVPGVASAAGPDRLDARGGAADAGAPDLSPGDRYVGMAAAPAGYWLATSGGGVFSLGGAPFHGSAAASPRSAPIIGIAARAAGDGYWLAGVDGAVYGFGAAGGFGSMAGQRLNRPIVGMAATPSGGGYWLVSSDGGVFSFGDAAFHGSLGGRSLVAPIVAMAAAPDGGYWLVASDGGVFAFGSARFYGSAGGQLLTSPVTGVATTWPGDGYWLVAADGTVRSYGTARDAGNGDPSSEDVVGVAATRAGGYYLLRSPSGQPAPAGSGTGRRIVYSNPLQRVWLVNGDDVVVRTYLVSGRKSVPPPGTYHVYSKSPVAYAGHNGITMRKMVRFTRSATSGIPIGFHDIPRYGDGRPMQTEDDLGGYRSAGCVRQSPADAGFLWDWTPVGTKVVVIY